MRSLLLRIIGYFIVIAGLMSNPVSPVCAQQSVLDEFTALRSSGPLPEDVASCIRRSEVDYAVQKKNMVKVKRVGSQQKFEIASGYFIDEMFLSGKVVFGDPIAAYVNKVADSLLVQFPEIRKELRFYITRSTAANAYSTDQGVIFINIGLIARLQNEAELAYIIAHEVVHYIHKHNITIFLEKEKVWARKNVDPSYKQLSISERILAINCRSKEIESLADQEGMIHYLLRSSYDPNVAESVFDILLYAEYPFLNEPFDLSIFESPHMKIPTEYRIDSITPRDVSDAEWDSSGTHPSVQQRKRMMRALLDTVVITGNKRFIHPEPEFHDVVNLARFEVIRQLLIQHRLAEVVYCAGGLLDEFPENFFLRKSMAAALYGICKYSINGVSNNVVDYYDIVSGEAQTVHYFFNKLSWHDLEVITFNYIYRLHQEFPTDAYLNGIYEQTFQSLYLDGKIKPSFFSRVDKNTVIAQNEPDARLDTTFTRFAFTDLAEDTNYLQAMNGYTAFTDSVMSAEASNFRPNTYFPEIVITRGIPKADRKYVHKLVMADPYTVKADMRKRTEISYQESNVHLRRVKDMLSSNASRAGLDLTMADAIGIGGSSPEVFNEMTFVNEYIEERFNQAKEGIIDSYSRQFIDSLMKRNDTEYLGWTAVLTIQKRKPIFKLVVMSVIPYFWPYTIYQFVQPREQTYYYYVMFNVNSGNLCLYRVRRLKAGLRNDHLNSQMYDFMNATQKYYE